MKTLFVLRHAKSSWNHPELSDFERPLNKRGKKAAPRIGREMAERGYLPEIIISSPATRAAETVKLVAEAAEFTAEVVYDKSIYGAGRSELFYVISEISDSYSSALIAGHNPGFEQLVETLVNEYKRMPTAALAVLDLDIKSWNKFQSGCGEMRDFLIPKELP